MLVHATKGGFPTGHVPLTPAAPCCDSRGTCNTPAAWQHPIWKALAFAIEDEHRFRYAYESDGKTFTVKAVGDLDCDATEITYVMIGDVGQDGEVRTKVTEPARNTD
jgi:hypothetical protein